MARRHACLLLLAALAPTVVAQEPAAPAPAPEAAPPMMMAELEPKETIRLWPGDAPGALGTADQDALVRELSAHDRVPPLFIWHTFDDAAVKLEPILELSLKLKALGRPHELHVYESGRHGLGLGVRPYEPSKTLHPWTVECARWLSAHGW
ncbi:MAG: hypothetical protein ACKOZU_05375 [Planctomycetaceae bacterium]